MEWAIRFVSSVSYVFLPVFGSASAALSPASIFSAASSRMPGITWLYVPNAMSIEA